MRSSALALISVLLTLTAARGDDTCKAQAAVSKLRGEDFRSFMKDCKAVAEMVCNGRAIDQQLADEAKDSFTKKCVKDEIGR